MWADNETSLDLINVQHLVRGVTDIIRQDALLPVTLGVYGGWGQGKSSLIKMVQEELGDEEGIVCVTFNGWLFESYDDAKSALMGSILEKVAEERKLGPKARGAMRRLAGRIDWFRTMSLAGKGALTLAAGGAPGLIGLGGVEALGSILKEETPESEEEAKQAIQTVRGFREDFVELMEETNIDTLVVFIDELDRCLPNAVVETLEAIRLFLFVEGTAFVIGADEELVRHAVDLRFEHAGLDGSVGGRYLEKMIQIPFRIPPMSPRAMKTYMNLLFTQLHTDEGRFKALVETLPQKATAELGEIRFGYEQANELLGECPPELAESFALTAKIGDVLTHGLKGNPRQLKRFLNMLLLRLKLASLRGLDLERKVFGKLMLLEYFHPKRFGELADWEAVEGPSSEIRQLEEAAQARRKAPAEEEAASADLEEPADIGTETSTGEKPREEGAPTPLQDELREWLGDDQLREWLQMDPQLGGTDLRPYFYITREQTGPLPIVRGELSEKATNLLRMLRSDAKSYRAKAEAEAAELSPAEAAAVFRHLSEDVERAEVLSSSGEPPLDSVFSLVDTRGELATELAPLFRGIPPARLPVGVVPAVETRLKESHPADLNTILTAWSQAESHNARLARQAKKALSRLKKDR